MSYKHWKSKKLISWIKYWTRKSWKVWTDKIFPRQNWDFWQTESSRSRRRKMLRKFSNRKIRKTKWIWNWGNYKKYFDLPYMLD